MNISWRALFHALLVLLALSFLANPAAAAPLAQPPDQCIAGLEAFYDSDNETALQLLEESYPLLDGDTSDRSTAETTGDCALVLCSLRLQAGEIAGADEACQLALEIYTGLSDIFRLGMVYNEIGNVYAVRGDRAAAIAAYERSVDAATQAENPPGVVEALNNMGLLYYDQGRLTEAAEILEMALQTAREADDPLGQLESLVNLGRTYKALGRYLEAAEVLAEAVELASASSDQRGEASALVQQAELFQAQGSYDEAMEVLQTALEIARDIGDDALEATILGSMGGVHWATGYYAEALDLYEQALALVRSLGDIRAEGHYLNSIGLVHQDQGRYRDAEAMFQDALTIARAYRDLDEEAAALHNLGSVYSDQGRFAEALTLYEQSLAIVQATGFRLEESIVLNSIALIYSEQGRYSEAMPVFDEALQIAKELGALEHTGNIYNNMGYVQYELGQADDAIAFYKEALTIAEYVGDRAETATRLGNLGVVYDLIALGLSLAEDEEGASENYTLALDYYQQALDLYRAMGDLSGEITMLNNIGALQYSTKEYDDALATVENALALARPLGDPVLLGRTLANAAQALIALGDDEQAARYLAESMQVVEEVRAMAGSEAGRAGFAERFADVYVAAVGVYHRLGQDETAFYTSERGRSRAFLDSLATGQIELSDEAIADLLARQQELYAQRLAAQDALARALARTPPDQALIEQARADLAALDAQYSALLDSIAERNDQVRELVPGRSQILNVAEVQALLDADTTLVSFYVLNEEDARANGTLAFLLTQNTFEVVELPDATEERLRAALDEMLLWLDLESAHPQPLVDLHTWLFAPLLEKLKTPKVGIVPHQMLHYAPFAAFSDGTTYLGERFTLFILPSASALPYILRSGTGASSSQDSPQPELPALVYGNPATNANLSLLVYSAEEAESISNLFAVPAYIGDDASEGRLWMEAPGTRLIHLAAHGHYNRANPLYSALYLAPDPTEDGRLEVREVYALDLAASDLVVLSACQTQLGQLSTGDELVGLTRAFFFAGAPSVIASLWVVDDQATRDLMLTFYTQLSSGLSKGEALAAAQAAIRQRYPSPYYWAAFVLNGDPGPVTGLQPATVEHSAAPDENSSVRSGPESGTPVPSQSTTRAAPSPADLASNQIKAVVNKAVRWVLMEP